ncbi:DsrE family protein [Aquisalimonas asiatica]|uniref:DsrE/DsrF-like family protein n=1 Tax=Aquisalimonas asiatica TaxID=406100 RepID=A0A1H8RNB7_9GAMM|nr:DsrE family protein [Aquisalimonas asiatica]SEO67688.1 hypothetical protein SAMN04488052_102129 [Aquisalimonas asiatica]
MDRHRPRPLTWWNNHLNKKLFALLMLGSLAFGTPTNAEPDNKALDEVMIVVTSRVDHVQGEAMLTAIGLARKQHDVHILLCGQAAALGLRIYLPPALAPRHVSARELMQQAMSYGATASVCHLFLPNSGYKRYTTNDLLPDVDVSDFETTVNKAVIAGDRVVRY